MKFNEKQTKIIYDFVMNYSANEEFKRNVEEKYNNEVESLSILEIYALEEVLRFGTKNLFHQFIATKENLSVEKALSLFDSFLTLLREDKSFKDYKINQLKEAKDTLSAMEIFALKLILKNEKQDESVDKKSNIELEYDNLNPIKFETDSQIRTTIENLLIGKFILNVLELPIMREVKGRQKGRGIVANSDKQTIIEEIRNLYATDPSLFKNAVDTNFVKIKYQILLGKKEQAFGELLTYNTNISIDEVLGNEKSTFEEDIKKYFQDIINKRKAEENIGPKK